MTGDGLRRYEFDAAGRLANVTTGSGIDAPTTRYVHNALGQRLFKTEPQYAPVSSGSNPADPGVMQALIDFFGSLWGSSPTSTSTAAAPSASDKLGYQYYYDEDGSLLYEQGTGGAQSTGASHYVYLPTPAGPMPIATYTGSKHYAVHTDHLNTPRRLTQSNKQVAWQWAFSAFGDEQPTIAKNRFVDPASTPNAGSTAVADVTFNLRYPGQYFDKESGLSYNYFRSYDSRTGRYSQSDPIGLQGGWNRFAYVENNPLAYDDPFGLAPPKGIGRPIDLLPLEGGGIGGIGGPTTSGRSPFGGGSASAKPGCPPDLKNTLERIKTGGTYPHRNDGSVFNNKEGVLPTQPQGYYREYVHPTPGTNGPGAQRVVTGRGGEIYYTPDHYRTFIPATP
jgi:RHS repeat-associated protein